MIRRVGLTALAVVLIVAGAVGVSLITPLRRPPSATVDLPLSSQVTCIPQGTGLIFTDGQPEAAPVGSADRQPTPAEFAAAGTVSITSDRLLTGGVIVDEPQRAFAPCGAPMTSGMLLITDPTSLELQLVNSDANEAAVDLTLFGPAGEVLPVGARGIAIAPGVTRTVALSVLAPDGPVGVAFSASHGRVSVLATAVESRPTRFVSPGIATTSHLIAGVPAAAPGAMLLVSNPGEDRVAVRVEALTTSATYTPEPAASVSVPARSTVAVDLGTSLGGEASALRVSAPEVIGAAVVVDPASPSHTTLTASATGARLGANAPSVTALHLTNPGTAAVTAEVTMGEEKVPVEVAPGRTVSLAPAGGSYRGPVTVDASGDLAGAIVSAAATGTVVVPMALMEDPPREAGSVLLDPGLR